MAFFILPSSFCLLHSQDIHFSQYFEAPANLNPAFVGQFDGDYRLIFNHRDQWRSVTRPYTTSGGSFDATNVVTDGLGAGLSIYRDITGDSRLQTVQVLGGVSKDFGYSKDSTGWFVSGAQIGFTNRSINYDDLRFDEQWNGQGYYDPSIAHSEQFQRNARSYFQLNWGISYAKLFDDGSDLKVGWGVFNLNQPKQSFFDNDAIKLDLRNSFHAVSNIVINEEWIAQPRVQAAFQGKYTEVLIGGNAKYVVNNTGGIYRTVFGGFHYRSKDAGYLMLGMEYDEWTVGLSYDFNLSSLTVASNGRGGFELSIQYIIRKRPEMKFERSICPDYI